MSPASSPGTTPPRWRRWLFSLHRDVGFVCLGLTLCYAVSGVAVNHRHHWNYNYSASTETIAVGTPATLLAAAPNAAGGSGSPDPSALARARQPEIVARIGGALGIERPARNAFWRSPERLSLYFGEADSDVVEYEPETGLARRTLRRERPLLRWLNALHLNEHRRVWTWVADAFALLLAFLAISGVVMVRGRRGILGRGGLLALAGIVIPITLVLLLG